MIWIALLVMMTAGIAHHLGLPQAVASVMAKIARCIKCFTFWSALVVLLVIGADLLIAVMLSVIMAYLSHYWGLLLGLLLKVYNRIWQRMSNED
jgi:hypothetical protein